MAQDKDKQPSLPTLAERVAELERKLEEMEAVWPRIEEATDGV